MEENAAVPAGPPQRRGSTPFRGVRIIRPSGKYGAELTVPGERRRVWLGTFRFPETAALAYDRAARSYGVPEHMMNFPRPNRFIRRRNPPATEESTETTAVMPFQIDLNFPPPLD